MPDEQVTEAEGQHDDKKAGKAGDEDPPYLADSSEEEDDKDSDVEPPYLTDHVCSEDEAKLEEQTEKETIRDDHHQGTARKSVSGKTKPVLTAYGKFRSFFAQAWTVQKQVKQQQSRKREGEGEDEQQGTENEQPLKKKIRRRSKRKLKATKMKTSKVAKSIQTKTE